jgi:hypothetical protein
MRIDPTRGFFFWVHLFDIKEIGENSKKLAKLEKLVEFTLEKSLISKNFPILLEKK